MEYGRLSGLPLKDVRRFRNFTDWKHQVDIRKAIGQWDAGSGLSRSSVQRDGTATQDSLSSRAGDS